MGEEILSSESQNTQRNEPPRNPNDPDLKQFGAYARTFFLPTLILKVFLLYFGLNYSRYPGEGYGYGLLAALVLSALNFGYFIWTQTRSPS